jgi:nucleotide-binding universal stress UspA family protein
MAAKPIVAGTDGSEESLRAVGWAAREAALRGAPLRIVSAEEAPPGMITRAGPGEQQRVTDVLLGQRDQALATAAERAAQAAHGVLIDTDTLTGSVDEALTDAGSGALMLVLGSRGRGSFTALLLGSASRYVATHASCPVVVIRDEPASPHGIVGVGVADLDSSGDALTFAFEEASLRQASLLVLHAWHTPETEISRAGSGPHESGAEAAAEATGHLTALLDDWRTKYPGVPVSQEIVHGHPSRALVGLSARADLVVIGRAASHSGRPGRGSVRHALLNHAHGPVVTVPSS